MPLMGRLATHLIWCSRSDAAILRQLRLNRLSQAEAQQISAAAAMLQQSKAEK